MTAEEKDRLEIVKEMCCLQNCTLQEIYDFVKAGKPSVVDRYESDRWISVKEALPKPGRTVIATENRTDILHNIRLLALASLGRTGKWHIRGGAPLEHPTHWYPIPDFHD